MTLGYNSNAAEEPAQPIPSQPSVRLAGHKPPRTVAYIVARSTARDSWRWLWKDTLGRVVPLTAGALAYAWLSDEGRSGMRPTTAGWTLDALLGVAIGVPLAGIAALYRAWVAPGYRLPTAPDQAIQTTFYLAVNAPAEELFWRGTVQSLAERLLRRVPALAPAAPPLGWAFATAAYAGYHRLGGWSWRSIAGVAAVGALFGALYQIRPGGRSLLAPTIAHGLATAGFLSWGDAFLHWSTLRRLARQQQDAVSENGR
jgi:hypothetical protein